MPSAKPDMREQIPVETSAGTGEDRTRSGPDPMTADLLREKKKLEESDLKTREKTDLPASGRVADAGDAAGGGGTAYDLETQADSVAQQSGSTKSGEPL
ncbi:hypothetical protein [Rhizobium sp. SSA_523]|uniref:hypothetical protein n=1 Tax=Rhizobium sp. SSA_523 TaxID=2952477 RepID=UPI0020912B63|nr:hypothetical protein [Rhizobium sp. SSA_523]MCO5731691.1 hypothetical protein [Rhizobium sp. SSA_523]WKC22933.1 hypothetical protein QTJ18_19080 [Rhizobium sp. SSA_523]